MADTLANAFAAATINDSAPALKQRRSQRFSVPVQPQPQMAPPPLPNYPGSVERSLSNDSSNGFVDYAASAHLQQQQQQYYAPQSFTPSPTGVPGQRASGSGIATWARSGLPPTWMADGPLPPPPPMPMGYPSPAYAPPVAMHSYAPGMDFDDDELIPTALVLKNIAFSIRPEKDLNLPLPSAFNYHYDDGVFRGLAFANFRYPAEAEAAQAALNGYELQGRRLRVEWKRMLRAGEKERIERDKAIKRMRSAVSMNAGHSPQASPAAGPSLHRQHSLNGLDDGGYEDYGSRIPSTLNFAPPPVPPMPSMHAYPTHPVASPPSDSGMSGSSNTGGSGDRPRSFHGPTSSPAPASSSSRYGPSILGAIVADRTELDMNDAQTLEIYSRVLLFRDDALRDEFAFSRSLTPQQRRIVHLVAQKLGLEHGSTGEGDSRQVVVYKAGCGPPRQPPALRHAASSIYAVEPGSPGGSPATLRGKKSLGDVRAYANGTLPARRSIGDLRGGYAAGANASPRRGGDGFYAPPVPPLPATAFNPVIGPPVSPVDPHPGSLPFAMPDPPSATVIRQPRGPTSGDAVGFTRGRPSPDL